VYFSCIVIKNCQPFRFHSLLIFIYVYIYRHKSLTMRALPQSTQWQATNWFFSFQSLYSLPSPPDMSWLHLRLSKLRIGLLGLKLSHLQPSTPLCSHTSSMPFSCRVMSHSSSKYPSQLLPCSRISLAPFIRKTHQ